MMPEGDDYHERDHDHRLVGNRVHGRPEAAFLRPGAGEVAVHVIRDRGDDEHDKREPVGIGPEEKEKHHRQQQHRDEPPDGEDIGDRPCHGADVAVAADRGKKAFVGRGSGFRPALSRGTTGWGRLCLPQTPSKVFMKQ